MTLPPPPTMETAKMLWPVFHQLYATPQDPRHHAEGNAGVHTAMVVEALPKTPGFSNLDMHTQHLLGWTALFHDIGKISTTKTEDGRITSKGHSSKGARLARALLWKHGIAQRHDIAALIHRHQLPFWIFDRPKAERLIRQVSQETSWSLLFMHAYADLEGRVCADKKTLRERLDLGKLLVEEQGCLHRPYPYPSDEARVADIAYNRNPTWPGHSTGPRFTLMCGLPGSGKDTWIAQHKTEETVISLDVLRKKLRIPPGKPSGTLIAQAREQMKKSLRAGKDCIWNATNLRQEQRSLLLRLAMDYKATTRIVWVETSWAELWARNAARDTTQVPKNTMLAMIEGYQPPNRWETHDLVRIIN